VDEALKTRRSEQASAAVAARRAEQQALVAIGRVYVESLKADLPLVAAAIVGSVARGDFNVWSDVDVVVVAGELPTRLPDRLDVLMQGAPARIEAIGFTPAEFHNELIKQNPLVVESINIGVRLFGEDFFGGLSELRA